MMASVNRNGADRLGGRAERRAAHRRRVLKGATVMFNNGFCAFECVLRDQSEEGARVSLAETFAIPSKFRLAISGEDGARTARVVWRGLDQLGVRFE